MTATASTPARSERQSVRLARFSLAGLLAFAAVMHAILTPEHFAQSTLMGIGFVAAAIVELALAAAVLLAPMRWVYAGTIVVAAGLIGLYAWNVMVGLPFVQAAEGPAQTEESAHPEESAHAHESTPAEESAHAEASAVHGEGSAHDGHHDGLVIGAGEPVDAAGAVTKGAEIGSIALAAFLLRRRTGDRREPA